MPSDLEDRVSEPRSQLKPTVLTYLVYGMVLESELALPGLAEVDVGDPDLSIRFGDFQTPVLHHDGPLRYLLDADYWYFRWPGEATYRLGDSELVVMMEGSATACAERVAGPLFGLLLRRLRRVVLHGNVVARESRALCLLGSTGAGKTTFTRTLVDAGWLFLSDDLCVLQEEGDGWLAHAGPSRLKVRTSAPAKAIETPARTGETAHLSEIVVLEPGVPVSRRPLHGAEALLALIRHAHMPRSLDVANQASDHLHQSGRLASSVSISLVKRGESLTDLPLAISLLDVWPGVQPVGSPDD